MSFDDDWYPAEWGGLAERNEALGFWPRRDDDGQIDAEQTVCAVRAELQRRVSTSIDIDDVRLRRLIVKRYGVAVWAQARQRLSQQRARADREHRRGRSQRRHFVRVVLSTPEG